MKLNVKLLKEVKCTQKQTSFITDAAIKVFVKKIMKSLVVVKKWLQ